MSDPTPHLQNAITALSKAGGGTITLQPQAYQLSAALVLPANVCIAGPA